MITSKSRYALKVMLDLAMTSGTELQQRKSIAKRQNIPEDYIDHIIIGLRKADLITTVRGKGGGIRLNKLPSEITVRSIIQASEVSANPIPCLVESEVPCAAEGHCVSKYGWSKIMNKVNEALESLSLADVSPLPLDDNAFKNIDLEQLSMGCPVKVLT